MRTLVIGGTLFIGREIVRRLASRGHDVTVLHRRDHHDLGPEIRNLKADRGDLQATAVDKAKRILGFAPTSLDAALRDSFAWYRQQPPRRVDYSFEDRLIAART